MWLTVRHVEFTVERLFGAKDEASCKRTGVKKTDTSVEMVIKCQPAFIRASLLELDEVQMLCVPAGDREGAKFGKTTFPVLNVRVRAGQLSTSKSRVHLWFLTLYTTPCLSNISSTIDFVCSRISKVDLENRLLSQSASITHDALLLQLAGPQRPGNGQRCRRARKGQLRAVRQGARASTRRVYVSSTPCRWR